VGGTWVWETGAAPRGAANWPGDPDAEGRGRHAAARVRVGALVRGHDVAAQRRQNRLAYPYLTDDKSKISN
jgi:hypothetical protein